MPSFICTKCGCLDNTAARNNYYISRSPIRNPFNDEYANSNPLCTECTPTTYMDGSRTGAGVWHNLFPKIHWSEYGMERLLEMESKNKVKTNIKEYFVNAGLLKEKGIPNGNKSDKNR